MGWTYIEVFIFCLLVDVVPFVGPPAWTVMVYFQISYSLNVWIILPIGVLGSALGRYILSRYVGVFSVKVISADKKEDLEFIGNKLSSGGWKALLFIFLYTLVPLPSIALFIAAGLTRMRAMQIVPAFFAGKFISDMVMVLTGDYAARNIVSLLHGLWAWQTIAGAVLCLLIIMFFIYVDWRTLFRQRKLTLRFHIWK